MTVSFGLGYVGNCFIHQLKNHYYLGPITTVKLKVARKKRL